MLAAWLAVAPVPASAHPLAPSLLELREAPAGRVEAMWRTPALRAPGARLEPVLPDACRRLGEPRFDERGGALTARIRMDCGSTGLTGLRVGVDGLERAGTDALLRVVRSDGQVVRALLTARVPQLRIPERPQRASLLGSHVRMGVEHLWLGADHMLVLIGLLLWVEGWRALLLSLTAFTAGHAVTLSLAALGLVQLPRAPIEIAIAATLLVLAAQLARVRGRGSPSRPWALALPFGLLHGLGFATALAEVGLPRNEIPTALLGFNLGIELGQLGLVALAWAVWRACCGAGLALPPRAGRVATAYAMGSLAGFWVFARSAAWLGAG